MLDARKTGIEKWQYLSVLKNADVHLFYRVFSKHVKVCKPPKREERNVFSD